MVLAARRRAEAGKAAGCRQAGMTAKARFEMCGDAGIVLRQEISHREMTKLQRSLLLIRIRRNRLFMRDPQICRSVTCSNGVKAGR